MPCLSPALPRQIALRYAASHSDPQAQIERDGLRIASPLGDAVLRAETVDAAMAGQDWDVILLSCKACDLEDAIRAIAPAMGEGTAVLPVLNGLSHLEALCTTFGAGRVLGGLVRFPATLGPDGLVRHLNRNCGVAFGEIAGGVSPRMSALAEVFAAAPGLEATLSETILTDMWGKLVTLATLAGMTVLMRGTIGEINSAPGGTALVRRMLVLAARIAAAQGHPVAPAILEAADRNFTDPASGLTASMLRDLERGVRIEARPVLGFLRDAGLTAGIHDPLLDAACLHAEVYESRAATHP